MRLAVLLVTLALGGGGYVYPADKPVLARAPTAQESLLASIASRLAGRAVSVRCGDPHSKEALGTVMFMNGKPLDYTMILPATCARLAAFAAGPAAYDSAGCPGPKCAEIEQTALALQVISHESYHLAGFADEAKAECYGLQSMWYVANRLGAPLDEAKALGHFYWKVIFPQHNAQWPYYYSPDCKNRGKLDLRQNDPRWPE